MTITVFDAEKSIAEKILQNRVRAYCQVRPAKTDEVLERPEFLPAKASLEDWDLFRFDSVLASSCWNENDDIFLPEELWNARSSIVHKPLNNNHEQSEIIGHVYASYVLDDKGKLYSSEERPSGLFDVCTSSVIYRYKDDEALKEKVDGIIEKIQAKTLYVSMECLFPNFDYGLIDENGEQKVIARSKTTAHLSKFLRAYGGNGVYDNNRIGRVLRSLNFSGHGTVEEPANKRSVILFASATKQKELKKMSDDKVKELEAQVLDLQKQIASGNLVKVQEELTASKARVEELTKANETLTREVEGLKIQKDEVNGLYSEAKTKLEAEQAAHATLKTAVEAEKAEAKKVQRTEALKNAGLKEDEAKAKVEKFNVLDDEQFNEMVSVYTSANKKTTTAEEVVETVTEAVAAVVVTPEPPLHEQQPAEEDTIFKNIAKLLKRG